MINLWLAELDSRAHAPGTQDSRVQPAGPLAPTERGAGPQTEQESSSEWDGQLLWEVLKELAPVAYISIHWLKLLPSLDLHGPLDLTWPPPPAPVLAA